MTQLIAIDAAALDALRSDIARLHKRLDAVQMTPKPEWVTVDELMAMTGKSRSTIQRRIREGSLPTKNIAGTRMCRINLDD